MAVSKERVKTIAEYYDSHGKNQTIDAFEIPEETLNRYLRRYKQNGGQLDDVMGRIRDKFSDVDLERLLKADMTITRRPSRNISFEGEDFCFLVMSDTHVGSQYFDERYLFSAFEEGHKQGCTTLLHGGDLIEGMSNRPGHIYELTKIGYAEQRNYAVELFQKWQKPMYFILGNHDLWTNTKSGVGLDVGEDIEHRIEDAHYLGIHEGNIDVCGAQFMLWHGEDGSSYATSYRVQKIIEAFTGGEKPKVLLCAHTHKALYLQERNVHAVSTGSIQQQSGFMRYKRLPAHCGFWIIRGKIRDGSVVSFSPTWYPFYKE